MAVRPVGSSQSTLLPIQTFCHLTFPIFQFPVITIWHRKPASIPSLLHDSSYSYYSSYSCSYSHYCKCPGHWPSPLYFPLPLTPVPSPPVSTGKSWCYKTISAWVAMVSEFHVFQSWALADWPVTLAPSTLFLSIAKGPTRMHLYSGSLSRTSEMESCGKLFIWKPYCRFLLHTTFHSEIQPRSKEATAVHINMDPAARFLPNGGRSETIRKPYWCI